MGKIRLHSSTSFPICTLQFKKWLSLELKISVQLFTVNMLTQWATQAGIITSSGRPSGSILTCREDSFGTGLIRAFSHPRLSPSKTERNLNKSTLRVGSSTSPTEEISEISLMMLTL